MHNYTRIINDCIKKGILADYLVRKGSEVVNMLIAEYDYDLDMEVKCEEAAQKAKVESIEQFEKQMLL